MKAMKPLLWIVGPTLLVVIVAMLILRPSIDLFPDSTPPAVHAPSRSAFPSASWTPVDATSLSITSVPFERGTLVFDFTTAGARLIAAGRDRDGAAAWYSDDGGQTWIDGTITSFEPLTPRAKSEIESVATFGSTVAALGTWYVGDSGEPQGKSIWVSSDGGATWTEIRRDLVPNGPVAILGSARGFIMTTQVGNNRLLLSEDGQHWDDLELQDGAAFRNVEIRGVLARGETLVVFGATTAAKSPAELVKPLAWEIGSDGEVSELEIEHQSAMMFDGVGSPGGFAIDGVLLQDPENFESGSATLWQTRDGARWNRIVLTESTASPARTAAMAPPGIIITGTTSATGDVIWFVPNDSSDVQTYPVEWNGIAAIGTADGFVIFGGCGRGGSCNGPAILILRASNAPYQPPPSTAP